MNETNKTPTIMAIIGAVLIFAFLFAPIPGKVEGSDSTIFLVAGRGEQWGLFLLAPLATFFICRNTGAWGAGSAGILLLLALSSAFYSSQGGNTEAHRGTSRYYPFSEPTILHWTALFCGVMLLLGAAIWTIRQPEAKPAFSASQTSGTSLLDDVDWGWWGIAAISLAVWPLGLLLYFAYSRTGDEKGGAAIIGAGIGLILMALRFVFIMSKVGAGAT